MVDIAKLLTSANTVADAVVPGTRKTITLSGRTVGETPTYVNGERTDVTAVTATGLSAYWSEATESTTDIDIGDAFFRVEAVDLVNDGDGAVIARDAIDTITYSSQNYKVIRVTGEHLFSYQAKRAGSGAA